MDDFAGLLKEALRREVTTPQGAIDLVMIAVCGLATLAHGFLDALERVANVIGPYFVVMIDRIFEGFKGHPPKARRIARRDLPRPSVTVLLIITVVGGLFCVVTVAPSRHSGSASQNHRHGAAPGHGSGG